LSVNGVRKVRHVDSHERLTGNYGLPHVYEALRSLAGYLSEVLDSCFEVLEFGDDVASDGFRVNVLVCLEGRRRRYQRPPGALHFIPSGSAAGP
jgi:hypothetical protein